MKINIDCNKLKFEMAFIVRQKSYSQNHLFFLSESNVYSVSNYSKTSALEVFMYYIFSKVLSFIYSKQKWPKYLPSGPIFFLQYDIFECIVYNICDCESQF